MRSVVTGLTQLHLVPSVGHRAIGRCSQVASAVRLRHFASGASKKKKKMPFYAVHIGKVPGVYKTWDECKEQTTGFHGARYKKFDTLEEAEKFKISGTKPKEPEAAEDSSKSKTDSPKSDKKDSASKKRKQVATDEVEEDETVKQKSAKTDDDNDDSVAWVDVYTDGCCMNNGKKGARAGVGVYWGEDDADNVEEPLDGTPTNNRAEITAALRAIQLAKKKAVTHLRINTDSDFVINSMTKWIDGWKKRDWKTTAGEPVKNTDDLQLLDKERDGIQFLITMHRKFAFEAGSTKTSRRLLNICNSDDSSSDVSSYSTETEDHSCNVDREEVGVTAELKDKAEQDNAVVGTRLNTKIASNENAESEGNDQDGDDISEYGSACSHSSVYWSIDDVSTSGSDSDDSEYFTTDE